MAHSKRHFVTTFTILMVLCAPSGVAFAHPIDDVRAGVYAWIDAWNDRDIIRYMSFYSPAFRSKDMDYQEWMSQKIKHFQSSSGIEVSKSDVWVFIEKNRATASFIQHYQDGDTTRIGETVLLLVNNNDQWRIISERWAPLKEADSAAAKSDAIDQQTFDAENENKENALPEQKKDRPHPDEIVVKNIHFNLADQTERVCFDLNTFATPVIFTLENKNPRVVLDINNVYDWKGEPKTPVNGRIVKQIRTYLHRKIHKLRIVLDLSPKANYVLNQTYDSVAYRHCIEVK